MNLKNIVLLLALLIVCSCSKDFYFKRDAKPLAQNLYQMGQTDQMVRNQKKYFDYYYGIDDLFYKVDSLTWLGNERILDSFLLKQKSRRIITRNLNELKAESYNRLATRNAVAMEYIDSISTSELIRITKKYGFPSYDRLKAELDGKVDKKLISSPHIVFVHSSRQFFPEVRSLVIKEYLKGRMNKNVCSHIFWHLNGREGHPFPEDFSHCKVDTLR